MSKSIATIILKQLVLYSFCLVMGFVCCNSTKYVIIGSEPENHSDFMKVMNWILSIALIHLSLLTSAVIAILYFLADVFFLRKKLKNKTHALLIRFSIILALAIALFSGNLMW
ncbi:MAG: hypothetical protein AAGA66_09125 [Bacteroidota bacterium]